jgi:hypothetical protein
LSPRGAWRLGRGAEAALALAAFVALLFLDAVLGRGVFFERDIHAYWHPLIASFRRIVQGGGWPLWNPDVGFGAPLLADPNLQLAYPPTWATLWVPPAAYYSAFVVLHCVWAGWGAYRLARAWSLSPLPAFVCGAAWSGSGPLLSSVSLFHHYASACWMPWVLWALERALRSPGRRSAALLALAAAGQLLAGSADMFVFTALAAAARVLRFAAAGGLRRAGPAPVARGLGLSALLAFLLCAVQWVPTAAQLRSGSRAGQALRTSTYWSLHPASLGDLAVPYLVSGLPWGEGPRRELFEGREPLLRCLYLGAGVLALAALGAAVPGATRARLLLALGVFFVLLALGRFTPAGYAFAVPPLSLLRYPMKCAVPAALCAALLAGFGLQAWLAEWSAALRRRAALLAGAIGALVLLGAAAAAWAAGNPDRIAVLVDPAGQGAGPAAAATLHRLVRAAELGLALALLLWWRGRRPHAPRWLTAALVGLVCADLLSVGRHVNGLAPAEVLHRRPAAAAALRPRDRVYSDPNTDPSVLPLAHPPAGWDPAWARAFGFREQLSPPTAALWGVRGSYDGAFTGMTPLTMAYLSTTVAEGTDRWIGVRLLRMGAVDAVLTMRELAGFALADTHPSVFAQAVRRYRVPDPLPRAYWVGAARAVPEPVSYAALSDQAFDPAREVLLAPGPTPESAPPAGDGGAGTVAVVEEAADRLVCETTSGGAGFLVVVGAFDSGWRARVDGRPAPVHRANVLFRAVGVPAGRHRVELRYRPPAVAWGAGLSALGALATALAWRSGRRRDSIGAAGTGDGAL